MKAKRKPSVECESMPVEYDRGINRSNSDALLQVNRAQETDGVSERGANQNFPFQQEMESAFGFGLGWIGCEQGQDEALSDVGARAAAVGDQIFLSANPSKEDVAHEVAHVIQNRNVGSAGSQSRAVSNPAEGAERQAESAAKGIARGDYKAALGVSSNPVKGSASLMRREGGETTPGHQSSGRSGSSTKMSQSTRNYLCIQLAQRTAMAADSFRAAGEAKSDQLHSAAKENAALGALLFSVGMSMAAPGIGTALAGVINSAGFKATYNAVGKMDGNQVNAIGHFYQGLASRAPNFVSAGTHIGKATFKSGIASAALESNDDSFIASAVQSFRETVQAILDNAALLSDAALLATVAQFDVTVMTDEFWKQKMDELFNTYERCVKDIAGPQRTLINLFEINKMTREPKFLALGRYHVGTETQGERWVVVKGFRPHEGGEIYELVPDELVEAAYAAHKREWHDDPPILSFIGGNKVGVE